MSGSTAEVQELADQILALMGARLRSGQMVIHFHEGVVQRVEVNNVYKARRAPGHYPLDDPA